MDCDQTRTVECVNRNSNRSESKGSQNKGYYEKKENILECGTPNGIGYWGSVAHIVRSTVGTSFLILPMEMKNLGYITATVLLLAVSIVYYNILHILLHLDSRLREHFKLEHLTFALVVDKIFLIAPFPFRICNKPLLFIIYVYYIVPIKEVISLIIISSNVQQIAKYCNVDLNFTIIITGLSCILTTFCLFKSNLKILVPFSSASNLCSLAIAMVIIVYSTLYRNPKASARPFAGDFNLVLRNIAINLNSVLSTEIILPVSNGMKNPQKMVLTFGSLNVSAFIINVFYIAFAFAAYVNLGDDIQENILANVPISNLLILSIHLVYSLALTVPYFLSFYASFDVIWSSKLKASMADSKCKYIVEYGICIGYNAFAYFLALGVSNLALISAIAGALGILLDVAFMPFLQLLLMYALKEINYWVVCKNVILMVFCSMLFFLSMTDCVKEVAKMFTS